MTATQIIIEALLSGQTASLITAYQAIKELAEDLATTDGFAHAVADWAENAQDRCKKLEERVKALENAHNNLLGALTAELALRIDYVKAFTINLPLLSKEPALVPDLDAKVIDFAGQVIRYAPEEMGIYYTDICDLFRAFAAELGVKP